MTGSPTRVLHLTTVREWAEAQAGGEYRVSTRGRTVDEVGFIHGSLDDQIAEVAEFVYADCDEDLVVLVMDLQRLRSAGLPVLFEDGGNGKVYPHIYGPVPTRLVEQVLPAGFGISGAFDFGT